MSKHLWALLSRGPTNPGLPVEGIWLEAIYSSSPNEQLYLSELQVVRRAIWELFMIIIVLWNDIFIFLAHSVSIWNPTEFLTMNIGRNMSLM